MKWNRDDHRDVGDIGWTNRGGVEWLADREHLGHTQFETIERPPHVVREWDVDDGWPVFTGRQNGVAPEYTIVVIVATDERVAR